MVTQPRPEPEPDPTEMENLEDFARKLMQVPKSEVDELLRKEKARD
jgi:hypothetical protein